MQGKTLVCWALFATTVADEKVYHKEGYDKRCPETGKINCLGKQPAPGMAENTECHQPSKAKRAAYEIEKSTVFCLFEVGFGALTALQLSKQQFLLLISFDDKTKLSDQLSTVIANQTVNSVVRMVFFDGFHFFDLSGAGWEMWILG